ncbi:MAG TPA: 16S rRNA (cytosine(967)-C(5))-methyltransferase RsmB, partial [Pseudomonadales bacterium]|nr:16S rRNA (cytosine(967)-C(5))-methyltransferase RsmB [Pseudomonadales bacterium]
AARAIATVIATNSTLDEALERLAGALEGRERALAREIAFGVCRRYFELDALLAQLLTRPLKTRDADLQALLLAGLYQLRHMRVPDHAAVSATVAASTTLGKGWARGLVNAVLRAHQARRSELEARLDDAQQLAHPRWLIDALREDWPNGWMDIVAASNATPPLTLRVNAARSTRAQWLTGAAAAGVAAHAGTIADDAVMLAHASDVARIPGFVEGIVSVQDEGAQLAATLLHCGSDQRVLDACAAPGGKACHLLERHPTLRLVALDASATRLERVRQNLTRLQLAAVLLHGDAANPTSWWDGEPFQHILVDAPCSGTGVIRRHPDIRILRNPQQVAAAATLQREILRGLWPCLAPGGSLLYTTCSVLASENEQTIAHFLAATPDASEVELDVPWGCARPHGRQLLPTIDRHDGFYYVLLRKAGGSDRE